MMVLTTTHNGSGKNELTQLSRIHIGCSGLVEVYWLWGLGLRSSLLCYVTIEDSSRLYQAVANKLQTKSDPSVP